MPVPLADLHLQYQNIKAEIDGAVAAVVRDSAFIRGPHVDAFERAFARVAAVKYCVSCANGTDALYLAMTALKVQPGDEVITSAHSWISASAMITRAGAVPVFCDTDGRTFTIDPAAIEAAITPRTAGILPVHLYGHPADLDPILAVAKARGLWVLEDACQAHGAEYRGRKVGAIGDLAAFSFYPGKNLGACGDAGAVTGNRQDLLDAVRRFREHGQGEKYFHETEGYTGRLDAIQAAFLRIKLPHLESWIEGRRRAAGWYREALAGISEVEAPQEAKWARHVYHLFVIRAERRAELQAHLGKLGIGTGLHYPLPLHLQKAYARLGFKKGSFPITERTSDRLLSLPMFAELTEGDVGRVADAVRSFYR